MDAIGKYQTPPVLLIIFNRLDTTKAVFEQIRNVRPYEFFIAADGPRNDDEKDTCNKVRKWVVNNIDWECNVHTLFRDINVGCGHGPAEAITWFFDHVEEGIILEDDCVPNLTFFSYCAELLQRYENDDRIALIAGTNIDLQHTTSIEGQDYFFSALPFTWGWASWRRVWKDYDYLITQWKGRCINKTLNYLFEDRGYQAYWRSEFESVAHKNARDIWDYQFFAGIEMRQQLCIIPNVNLISNIGDGQDATHTAGMQVYANTPTLSIFAPLQHPSEIKRNSRYELFLQENFYGSGEYISWYKRLKRIVRKFVKVCQSNAERLRLIAMFSIVLLHFADFSLYTTNGLITHTRICTYLFL